MSKQQSLLIEGIRNLSKEKATIIPALVETSDKEKGTINVITFEELKIPNVRVRSVIEADDKGMLIFPARNTGQWSREPGGRMRRLNCRSMMRIKAG
jgi:hypothetical protein